MTMFGNPITELKVLMRNLAQKPNVETEILSFVLQGIECAILKLN